MTLREIHQLSRLSAQFLGQPWLAKADEVWQGEEYLGRMRTGKLADYLCALHNAALPLANCVVMLAKKLADLRKVNEDAE